MFAHCKIRLPSIKFSALLIWHICTENKILNLQSAMLGHICWLYGKWHLTVFVVNCLLCLIVSHIFCTWLNFVKRLLHYFHCLRFQKNLPLEADLSPDLWILACLDPECFQRPTFKELFYMIKKDRENSVLCNCMPLVL